MRLQLALVLLVFVSGSARAWTLEPGVTLTSPGFELKSEITHNAADPFYYTQGGDFVLDTVEWRADPQPGAYWTTNLTAYDPTRIHWPGNTTGPGNMTLVGLGGSWHATGVYAFPPFEFNENETWYMTSGPQNTTLTKLTLTGNGTTLTDPELAEVQALAAFFGQPFIQLAPYIAGAIILLFLIPKARGFLHSTIVAVLSAMGVFAVTLSKTSLDGVATYATTILAACYVGILLYSVLHTINETFRSSPT